MLLTQTFWTGSWSLGDKKINSLQEMLATPRCRRDPLPRPVRILFYGAYVSHRVSLPGRLHYGCIDNGIKPRRWLQRMPHFIGGQARDILRPVQLRQSGCPDWHKNVFGPQAQPGSLTIVPERWDTAEVPSREEKIPRQLCVPMHLHVWRRGWATVRMGPSEWVRLKRNLLECARTQCRRVLPRIVPTIRFNGRVCLV